jgi:hypothetical protein
METRKASATHAPSMRPPVFSLFAAYAMAVPGAAGHLAQITVPARAC